MGFRIAVLLSLLIVSICVIGSAWADDSRLAGYISEERSLYDDATEISLTPSFTYTHDGLSLGLYWRSTMGDRVLLIAEVVGAQNFSPSANIKFKVDGEELVLHPAETSDYGEISMLDFGRHGYMNKSRKAFNADKYFIQKLLDAKTAVVRVNLVRGFAEGKFHLSNQEIETTKKIRDRMAYITFEKFYKKAWEAHE